MRKEYKILFIALFLFQTTWAQLSTPTPDIQNLYNQNYKSITYLGMDFSKAVLIGDFSEALGVGGDAATKNAYLKAWNNLVTGEFEKYDIKALVSNKNIATDLAPVMNLNYQIAVDSLSGYKTPAYTQEEIQAHIKTKYPTSEKGLGVVWLIESFDRTTNLAHIDFIVFNMKTKEIVMLKKLQTHPRGSGLRNFWAGAIYEAFITVEKSFIKSWKQEYNWN